jgi:lipopolysaccharide export system permease protein
MSVLRRYIHREAFTAVAFVTMGFLALFFFFDLIDELRWVGRHGPDGYQISHALLYVVLGIPNNMYELLPITVLIGTIYVMARLAQNSEFTIMRTSGVSPRWALKTVLSLGVVFTILTFIVGDYVAPAADKAAQLVKSQHIGRLTSGTTGAWLKERQENESVAVNPRRFVRYSDISV